MNRFLFNSIFCIPLTTVMLVMGSPIMADQNDPRLDLLFKNLKASVSFQKASSVEIQIWKIWMEHQNPRAQSSMFLGIEAMNNQQLGKALGHFNQLTEIEPEFAEGWNKRATVLYLMGRFKESEEDITGTEALWSTFRTGTDTDGIGGLVRSHHGTGSRTEDSPSYAWSNQEFGICSKEAERIDDLTGYFNNRIPKG